MIQEAELNAEADVEAKRRVESKNALEGYLYNMRNSLAEGGSLHGKIDASEADTLQVAVTDALKWLEENASESADSFDAKRVEVEATANPIVAKVYQNAAASGVDPSSGSEGTSDGTGPSVEEVD